MGGGYWLCFLPSYQHLFLHPGLKHTAWHLQTPNHTVPVTVCAAGREMTCSYIYQLSSKSLQMFRKLLAEWQLSVAISWKVILVSKQLIKKSPALTLQSHLWQPCSQQTFSRIRGGEMAPFPTTASFFWHDTLPSGC